MVRFVVNIWHISISMKTDTFAPYLYPQLRNLRSNLMQIVRAPNQGSLPPLKFLNIGSFDFKFHDQRCMWSLIIFLHSPLVDNGQTPSMSSHVFATFLDHIFSTIEGWWFKFPSSRYQNMCPKKTRAGVIMILRMISTFDSFNSETTNIARTWKRETYSEVLWCLFWNLTNKQRKKTETNNLFEYIHQKNRPFASLVLHPIELIFVIN